MSRFARTALALVFTLAACGAQAQNWPDRPIRLIVPFPAGSTADVISRLLVQSLNERLGQQVVIENRPGASGSIGADITAKATPTATPWE